MSSREVLTLQFGSVSNFVGTHIWNIEDSSNQAGRSEFDPNVFCRRTPSGRLNPRTVIFDAPENFGSLSSSGRFRNIDVKTESNQLLHQNAQTVKVYESETISPNDFLTSLDQSRAPQIPTNSDPSGLRSLLGFDALPPAHIQPNPISVPVANKSIRTFDPTQCTYWSDYLQARLHARSLGCVPGIYGRLATWQDAEDAMKKEEAEELVDRIRFFAEECDHLQGFQCVVDADTIFGGIASAFLTEIHDNYGNLPVLTFAMHSAEKNEPASSARLRVLNSNLTMHKLWDVSSVYIPIHANQWPPAMIQQLVGGNTSQFSLSAAIASAISTATLPLRLSSDRVSLTDLCGLLSPVQSRRLAGLAFGSPPTEGLSVSPRHGSRGRAVPLRSEKFMFDFTDISIAEEKYCQKQSPSQSWTVLRGVPTPTAQLASGSSQLTTLDVADGSENMHSSSQSNEDAIERTKIEFWQYLVSRPDFSDQGTQSSFTPTSLHRPLAFPDFSADSLLSHLYSAPSLARTLKHARTTFTRASKPQLPPEWSDDEAAAVKERLISAAEDYSDLR
eukprot:849244_1